jgi:hypothetical protein
MSKFDFDYFVGGGYDCFAVSKEKYTKEQALEIVKEQLEDEWKGYKYLFIRDAYVRHRAGISEDNEPVVGWWLEYKEHKRSCHVYAFHFGNSLEQNFHNEYEVVELQ